MKLKTLAITVAVLAVLSAVVFIARRPAPPKSADPRVNQPLTARTAIEQAAKIRLSEGGKTVEIVKQPDGMWRVPSYYDMPADFNKLTNLSTSLTAAKIDRLLTSRAEVMARLEFKDAKVELFDAAGKPLTTIVLGKTVENGGRAIRFGDEQKAYLATLNEWIDAEPKNWASSELLALKADDVAKIEVPLAEGGPVTLTRAKKEDPWIAEPTPAGQKVKGDKVSALLGSFANLRFSDTTALDDANVAVAKANARTVKLTTFDGKTLTVTLGRKPEEKKLKPPTAPTNGTAGPTALGSVSELTKQGNTKEGTPKAGDQPLAPEFETVPAGPVYVAITSTDAAAQVNTLMQKRAFQVSDYVFTGLPQKAEELFESATPPAPTPMPPSMLTPGGSAPAPSQKK